MIALRVSISRRSGWRHGSAWSARALIAACVFTIAGAAGRSSGEPMPAPASLSFETGGAPIALVLGDSMAVSAESGEEAPGLRSKKTALLWSLLGTALPTAASAPLVWKARGAPDGAAIILVGALIIGPSLGHFYAARPGPAFAGIGIRALAGGAVAVGGLAAGSEQGATSGSNAMAAIGAIVGGASLVWDILRAPHSAQVHNDKVRRGQVGILITPSISAAGVGLLATATF